jgi:hypothetical protein
MGILLDYMREYYGRYVENFVAGIPAFQRDMAWLGGFSAAPNQNPARTK